MRFSEIWPRKDWWAIREVDVRLAIEQVPEIDARAFQVHRIDLEVAPIECAIGIVMVDFARAARVFGALNGQRDAAYRPEFVAGVLLICGQSAAGLIALGLARFLRRNSWGNYQRPLEADAQRRLQRDGVLTLQRDDGHADSRSEGEQQCPAPRRRLQTPAARSRFRGWHASIRLLR